jgi:hypothetical protein
LYSNYLPIHWTFNEDEIARGCFQQDNATAHTARVSMTLLCDAFRNRKISNDIWLPPSPNLTAPEYYLWGEMKASVYKDSLHNILELKEAIADFIRNIPLIELSHVFANKVKMCRYSMCLQSGGGHFQHWL